MGLGGHLIWTSVIRTLNETSGLPVRVCYAPRVSDLLAGRLYRGDVSWASDPVFRGNPRIEFPQVVPKPSWLRRVDDLLHRALQIACLERTYDVLVLGLARLARGHLDAHLDLRCHRYVERETPEGLTWKTGGHIIDIILANYGMRPLDHRCEMFFSRAEEEEAASVAREHRIGSEYVVIEPNSKETWFGDLRAWPFERWQQIVDHIVSLGRYHVIQVGEGGGQRLHRVIDLSGKVPFRVAVCVMKRARLFLGLDGALMNAANAVDTPAVVVWGGTALPEFAGYPEMHTIICHYLECAPCGLRGGCPYDKACLTSIQVEEVIARVQQQLSRSMERPALGLASSDRFDT